MNAKDIVLYVLVLCCMSLLIVLVVKTSSPIKVNLNGYTMQQSDITKGDISDFIILGQRFSKTHTWNNSTYDCVNYTQDLSRLAKELGFKVEVIHGWSEDNATGHAWLRLAVDYEPQAGVFVDYSKTYPNQKVIR